MSKNGTATNVTFDLSKVTAGEVAKLQKALVAADTETAAAIYAKTAVTCPPEWGDPNDPLTYLGLPFYGEWDDLMNAWFDAGKNARASLRAKSGNT